MLQKVVFEATTRDNGSPPHLVVQGDKVLDAKPAGVVVVKGRGCDDMYFFSSAEAGRAWQKAHGDAMIGGQWRLRLNRLPRDKPAGPQLRRAAGPGGALRDDGRARFRDAEAQPR
jgi:hypothetical protein